MEQKKHISDSVHRHLDPIAENVLDEALCLIETRQEGRIKPLLSGHLVWMEALPTNLVYFLHGLASRMLFHQRY